MLVKDILKTKNSGNNHGIISVLPNTLLSDAVIIMADKDIGSVLVMEGERLCGLLSFREVIRVLAQRQKEQRVGPTPTMSTIPVEDVMDASPALCTPDMEAEALRSIMIEKHQRYTPVVSENKVVGVISFHDVARAMLDEQTFDNQMLRGYIRNWPA